MFHLKHFFREVTLDWTFFYVNELELSAEHMSLREGVLASRPAYWLCAWASYLSHWRLMLFPQEGLLGDEIRRFT